MNLNQTFFNVLEKFDYDQKEQDIISKHSRIQSRVNNELSTDYSLKGDGCEKTKNLIENYEQINTNANLSLVNYSEYFNSTQFTTNKDAFLKAVVFNLTVEPGFIINNTFYNNSLNLTAKNYYSILEFDYSNVEDFESAACSNTTLDIDFGSFEYINVSEYETKSFTEVEFNISEPECCIFGNCSKCKLNPELYPVIFVHGHSSFEKTPVENSYISLSKMQIRMGHEGFVNMGDIDIDTLKVDWYGMNYPVAVKGSYYYTIYYDAGFSAIVKKSLSIENYAIRLKEIVDTVKENTGAEKIVIVAHSMGGLVAREYMLLFGEDDVDKLIVIGTPNQGISGRAKQFCAALGNDKECEDMYKDSVFMKRLNHYIPKTDVYTIYGSGCDTDGKDGDGVIPADDVKLDYAKNFEVDGVCEDVLGVDLHRDMVDPEKYSEVYEIVSEIINP